MKPKPGYRGVEWRVRRREDGHWAWAFYPKTGYGPPHRGVVDGDREDAEAACKTAIDEWLGPHAVAEWAE